MMSEYDSTAEISELWVLDDITAVVKILPWVKLLVLFLVIGG